ncbi:unnamed protein product, partial [Ectocarpus sp. 13 AM-2016]
QGERFGNKGTGVGGVVQIKSSGFGKRERRERERDYGVGGLGQGKANDDFVVRIHVLTTRGRVLGGPMGTARISRRVTGYDLQCLVAAAAAGLGFRCVCVCLFFQALTA